MSKIKEGGLSRRETPWICTGQLSVEGARGLAPLGVWGQNGGMCGRYSLAVDARQIALHFKVDVVATEWMPSFSVAPSDVVPMVRERAGQRGLSQAKWGLRPVWAKANGPRPINARIETAATNGMFRQSFVSKRCLVPMTGYYEWVAEPVPGRSKPRKQPFAIATAPPPGTQELLAAAGLWAAYREGPEEAWQVTCTILTREARDASGQVHDRMPVFVQPPLWDWWLDPERPGQPSDTQQLLATSDAIAAELTTWKVSPELNNTRTVDPHNPDLLAESI